MRFPHATKDGRGRLRVGAAVGIRGDYLERAAALVTEGADALVMDVATAEGTRDLIERRADAVKVGVGPGSTCTTRIVTGAGAVMLGNLLAGTEESPGSLVIRNGRQYKTYRGMASLWATARRKALDAPVEDEDLTQIVAEGVAAVAGLQESLPHDVQPG